MRQESSDVMSRVRQHCVPVWSPTCAGPGSYCLDWQSNYGWLNKVRADFNKPRKQVVISSADHV